MKKCFQRLSFISILHFKQLVAAGIFLVVEALLICASLYITTEVIHINKLFLKVLLCCAVSTPPSLLVYKAIIKSWTGEKME